VIKSPCVILSMIGLVFTGPLWADGHGGDGGHHGGHDGGGHHHDGHHHGGHSHTSVGLYYGIGGYYPGYGYGWGGYGGYGWGLGYGFGPGYYGGWGYPGYYGGWGYPGYYGGYGGYGGYGYGAPYGYPPSVYIQRQEAPRQQKPANYWYYCRNPEGYYPYVKQCAAGWIPVPPQPSDQ
jgi:hypothetical protein